jgi:hypothetical protein
MVFTYLWWPSSSPADERSAWKLRISGHDFPPKSSEFPKIPEPEKATCYLSDIQAYGETHLARLYDKTSIHPNERFSMQV